ncbi:MAG: sigma-70 family RNA polymerase sigma factor [Magnetovibrio sp.]|nr:sigma-70 family RNA polymerase sigma factor [Magnetovibrio sp.]
MSCLNQQGSSHKTGSQTAFSNHSALNQNSGFTSFEQEWSEHYPMLLGHARRISYRICLEPEDILSQATVKVLTYFNKNHEIKCFPALMKLSIKQVYIDSKRNLTEQIFLRSCELDADSNFGLKQDSTNDVEQNHFTNETLSQVFGYVCTLPDAYKEIFDLRFLDECTFSEISNITGLSEVNARKKISTIRNKIQNFRFENNNN